MADLELLNRLAAASLRRVEYGLHCVWTEPDGTASEDWMQCQDEAQQQYRLDYWTRRGWNCTPLVRTVTTSGWEPAP